MHKKLTITLDEKIYRALHNVFGPRKISPFIEGLIRPHVIDKDLYLAYQDMSHDEVREKEAMEWSEGTVKDVQDEPR